MKSKFILLATMSMIVVTTGYTVAPPVAPSPTYPWSRTLDVPFTRQCRWTCGPTSLRMAMAFYGTWQTIAEISAFMTSIGDGPEPNQGGKPGVAPTIIMSAASHYGFAGRSERHGLAALKEAIAAGHPVIGHIYVNRSTGNPRYYGGGNVFNLDGENFGHYLVIVGLQANADGSVRYVVVNEPARGKGLKYCWHSFDAAWSGRERRIIRLR